MVVEHRIPDLIVKKRDGQALSREEICTFIQGVVAGTVSEAQTGAMLMAMFLKGMNTNETAELTRVMVASGECLEWPEEWKGTVVDKHSTGGVGDKISLALAPALAACGMKVPMISGRGLGFTGGTLDKLESIPGFQVSFSAPEIRGHLESVGCCIVGQTEALVPADKILYATRDVTGTVPSMPLIVASIMSKKAAENIDALVLETTFGKGSGQKNEKEARVLSENMIAMGQKLGIKTSVMLTKMDDPIGNTVGNALEVAEALQCLNGRGPSDLDHVVCKLGGRLLYDMGKAGSSTEGEAQIQTSLSDGSARARFSAMLVRQGVSEAVACQLCDPDANVFDVLPTAKFITDLTTLDEGYVHEVDALALGLMAHELGAGRTKPGEKINHAVGIQLTATTGQRVSKGQVWAKVHHDTPLTASKRQKMQDALSLQPEPPSLETMMRIIDVMD